MRPAGVNRYCSRRDQTVLSFRYWTTYGRELSTRKSEFCRKCAVGFPGGAGGGPWLLALFFEFRWRLVESHSFTFPKFGTQLVYRRKQVILILANKEGGAHVDENEDQDYKRLMTDPPLTFVGPGVQLDTPDLARFLTAQSGVEILDCLKRNFFPDEEVPPKWEFGVAPPIAQYMDRISLTPRVIDPVFPRGELHVTRRN